ncbi:M23 family metallopeptidase [Piscinibacter sp.]|uniref:M23 family metallopeptidase n=1 Tax=Piscinibacter sp. TaxID=1903157 RepID=UPI002C9EE213|nr:M23 family metallopeptidase [Albitalea sp.]HUG22135.1 M23 family metallopeptidase [Albitalea sp.]
MQILITHGSVARTRVLHFNRWQLLGAVLGLMALLILMSGTVYHVIFLKAAREGWPVVSPVVKLVVRDEFAQRDRFMRENLDAMAQRVGEMQAKLIKLEAMSERVSGLAGVKPEELPQAENQVAVGDAAKGGPFIPAASPSLDELNGWIGSLDELTDHNTDLYTLIESRLLETRLQSLLIPNSRPVEGPIGSGFGFRSDPFTGRAALHSGLDFPAEAGTPIKAAAGGVVQLSGVHPQYGRLVEVDHGRGLVTRYAHASKTLVRAGDIVKRGQSVALVGSTGRSTGPHLHFEVLLDGVPQNPAKFLASGDAAVKALAAARSRR